MSTEYLSDYQSFMSSKSMPSPAETPSGSPMSSRSRRSSRRATPRGSSSSPPPLPSNFAESLRNGDGTVFQMDPKRFTPTLHASLVSEILTLRRELEAKHRFIDTLESNFDSVKIENEKLTGQLSQNAKESRLAEQRFKTLEHGTLDAVEDLVRERDDAKKATTDLKSKVDSLTKTTRKQEEDSIRSQQSWEMEKQSWENERRQLERRVHVTEGRLRAFVEEMSAQQTAMNEQAQVQEEAENSAFKDSGLGNDSDTGSARSYRPWKHERNQSSVSFRSIPVSLGSPRKGAATTNLADELGFEEEDEYDLDEFEHDDEELLSDSRLGCSPGHRSSMKAGSKAKKILGLTEAQVEERLSNDSKSRSASERARPSSQATEAFARPPPFQFPAAGREHVNADAQFSRPASPTKFIIVHEQPDAVESSKHGSSSEIIAKDASDRSPGGATSSRELNVKDTTAMYQSQPTNVPLSPPETPIFPNNPPTGKSNPVTPTEAKPAYDCSATQTDFPPSEKEYETRHLAFRRSLPIAAIPIPSISIHPPRSAPTSPGRAVLPPGMADASAQTDSKLLANSCDASVQTEEIRIDTRPVKLPPHLLPSTLDSALRIFAEESASENMPEIAGSQSFAVGPPRRNSEKLRLKALSLPRPILLAAAREDERLRQSALTHNDGDKDKDNNVSAGAGVDNITNISHARSSSNGNFTAWRDSVATVDEHVIDLESPDIFGNTPGLARQAARATLSGLPNTVPEDRAISPAHFSFSRPLSYSTQPAGHVRRNSQPRSSGSRPVSARGRVSARSSRSGIVLDSRSPSPGSRASSSHGTSSQGGHTQPPPFPIPFRSSSRVRSGASNASSSSPVRHDFQPLSSRRSEDDVQHTRRRSLRKVQSSGTIKASARASPRRRRRAPQLTPIQSMAFDDAPAFDMTAPLTAPIEQVAFSPVTEEERPQARERFDDNETAIEDGDQEGVIVDAIAATMVGEWLWKYVRRRKSFGIGEATPGDDGTHGIARHKRWVWLSPYERTIMWSSKQPNSGSALLGKTGRKLSIKSVLDVKDDKPLPKSVAAGAIFNRSILILTPERALKFTAPNKDRHYLWLTALSFLAQSGRGPPQVPRVPPPEAPEEPAPKPRRPSFGVHKKRASVPRNKEASGNAATKDVPVLGPPFQPRSDHQLPAPPTPSDAADAPAIPRMGQNRHQRRRSNTNPSLPPPSLSTGLRSFSSNAVSSTVTSGLTRVSTNTSTYRKSQSTSSRSGSRSASIASPEGPNFFEAVGTVQMDAFVATNYHDGVLYLPTPPPVSSRANGRRRGDSILSASTEERRGAGYVFDENGSDPFKGF